MATSNASQPVRTSAASPDTLPIRGYTVDQLKNYIVRQLGGPVWNVELTDQQILDTIQDALSLYSQWVPTIRLGAIQLVRGQFKYLAGVDVGLGVVKVDFVEPNPVPTEIFYGNLINPAPLFRTGLDEYDIFLRWRKTWARVTSIQPDWIYDEIEKALYIHNPIERYYAGVQCYGPHTRTEDLDHTGAEWVKKYAMAKSSLLLGSLWMKFTGAIPGPVKDIQLDSSRRDKAEAEVQRLEEKLQAMQRSSPVLID